MVPVLFLKETTSQSIYVNLLTTGGGWVTITCTTDSSSSGNQTNIPCSITYHHLPNERKAIDNHHVGYHLQM